jgi:hypothetical protein
MEEQRLAVEEFNQIQAWGIFRGLGKFFRSGFPKIELLKDESRFADGKLELVLNLEDNSGIDPKTIETYFDSTKIYYIHDIMTDLLLLEIENVNVGEHTLRVNCANQNGNYAFPYEKKIIITSSK